MCDELRALAIDSSAAAASWSNGEKEAKDVRIFIRTS